MVNWKVSESELEDEMNGLGYDLIQTRFMGQDPSMHGITGLALGQSNGNPNDYAVVHFTDWGQHPNPRDRSRGVELYWGHYKLSRDEASAYMRNRIDEMRRNDWLYPDNNEAHVFMTGNMEHGYQCPNCGLPVDTNDLSTNNGKFYRQYKCSCGCRFTTEQAPGESPHRYKAWSIDAEYAPKYNDRPIDERTYLVRYDNGMLYNAPYSIAKGAISGVDKFDILDSDEYLLPNGKEVSVTRQSNRKSGRRFFRRN